jgi:hypothetical protein
MTGAVARRIADRGGRRDEQSTIATGPRQPGLPEAWSGTACRQGAVLAHPQR